MSLQKAAPIQLAFSGGLDTKSSSPSVQPTQLIEAENVQFTNPGELSKRLGSVEISASSGPGEGFQGSLSTYNTSELVLAGRDTLTEAGLWSYNERGDALVLKGSLRSPEVTTSGVWNDPAGQISPDCCTAGGITLYAWNQLTQKISEGAPQALSSVSYSIVDEATQAVIVSNVALPASGSGTGQQPSCVAVGNNLFVWYVQVNGGTNHIEWSYFNVNTPAVITSGVFTPANLQGIYPFGVRPINETTQFVYWTAVSGGTTTLNGQYFDNLGNPLSPSPISWSFGTGAISCVDVVPCPAYLSEPAALMVLVGYIDSSGHFLVSAQSYAQHGLTSIATRAITASTEATQIMNITGIQNEGNGSSAGTFDIFWELAPPVGSPNYDAVVRSARTSVALSSQSGPNDLYRSAGLQSKAFLDPILGNSLVWITYDDDEQPTYFCTDANRHIVAKTLQNYGYGLSINNTFTVATLPKANLLSNGTSLIFAFPARVQFTTAPGGLVSFTTGVKRVELDFTDERFRSDQLGEGLHYGGGIISTYDGAQVVESGYNVFPPAPSGRGSTVGVSVPTPGVSGKVPQITDITFPPDVSISDSTEAVPCGAQLRAGQYFIIFDGYSFSATAYIPGAPIVSYLWFCIDGAGVDPNLNSPTIPTVPSGGVNFPIKCNISAADTLVTVIAKATSALNGVLGAVDGFLACTATSTGVQITSLAGHGAGTFWGNGIQPACTDTQMAYSVLQAGTTTLPEITSLVFPAGAFITGGQSFLLESSYRQASPVISANTLVQFYFVRTDMPHEPSTPTYVATPPAGPGGSGTYFTSVAIDIQSTYTAQQVASAVYTAVGSAIATGPSLSTAVVLWGKITGVGPSANILWGPVVETVCSESTTGNSYGVIVTTSLLLTKNADVGGNITAGTRLYEAAYEWVSAKGEYSISAPSAPFTAWTGDTAVTMTAGAPPNSQTQGSSETLSIPTYRLTGRNNCQIGLYRTIAAESGGASIFYKVATLPNNPFADTVTYQDTTSDSDLLSGVPLYTSSGEVANISPPPAQVVTQHLNRIFLAALDDENTIWYSKPWSLGYAVGFSPDFTIAVDQAGGPITALGSQDSYLVIFKQSRILVIEGNGPDVTGNNGQFSPPTIVNTDVGAINQDSIVFTPLGTLFQSLKGIYLLDRALNVTYVGAPVEGFNDLTITSAVLMPTVSQVRFGTDEGTTLLYDYQRGQWSTFTYGSEHATTWGSTYVRVADSGEVFKEQPGTYTDAGTPVALKVVTAWFKPGNALQGFARVWRVLLLGKYLSGHNVQVGIAINYDPTIVQYATFDAMAVLGGNTYGTSNPYGVGSPYGDTSGTPVEQFRIHLGHLAQKAQSYQFTITELPSGAPGAGLVLQGIGIEAGVKGTTFKVSSTRQGQ